MPSSVSLPSDIPDHFDELISESEINLGLKAAPAPRDILNPDEFHTVFCGGFNFSHHITGLQSLKVDKNDEAARGASQALYDTILDVPMLHFMLKPGGKWMERGFAILAFAGPMAQSLNAELAEKKGKPKKSRVDVVVNGWATEDEDDSPTPTAPGEPDELARYTLTGGQA